jgi:hypothetical protein
MAGDVVSPTPSKATRHSNIKFIWSHAGGSLLGWSGDFLEGALAQRVSDERRLRTLACITCDASTTTRPVPRILFRCRR